METEAKYIKKIRDALKKKTGGVSKIFSGPNTKAKYLNDIAKTIEGMDIGGSKAVIINGECITSFEQEVYKCNTPFADVRKAIKDGKDVKLSITNDFAHAFGNIGDYFKFKSMEVDPLSEEITSITFERLYKKSSTALCNDTIIYSATDTNNEHTLIKTEWAYVEKSVTLTAGQTTASFDVPTTEISDLSSSTIDIYTSIWGAEPTDVRISGTTLNIDFDAQQTNMTVKVRLS